MQGVKINMSIKQVHVCDGCGAVLEKIDDIYHLNLKTDRFWNGVEMDCIQKNLEFCQKCANSVKDTLIKIAERKKPQREKEGE